MTFAPYGVAFTRTYARSRGVNPVWYIDRTTHPTTSGRGSSPRSEK